MNIRDLEPLKRGLEQRRRELLADVAAETAERSASETVAESELEEQAQRDQEERIAYRLDEREVRELEAIDAALRRMATGEYGECPDCGGDIAPGRLRVLPTAELCVDCAEAAERQAQFQDGEEEGAGRATVSRRRAPRLPENLARLSNAEATRLVTEQIQQDERIDSEELSVECTRGVVYLSGALPSEPQRQILRKLVGDIIGFTEIVDRVHVDPMLWQQPDRTPAKRSVASPQDLTVAELEAAATADETEDVIASEEEGLSYVAPTRPPREETLPKAAQRNLSAAKKQNHHRSAAGARAGRRGNDDSRRFSAHS